VQDIPLPDLTADYQSVLVTKYVVERGVCARCGKATSGRDLGGAVVALGPNVRLLVCHLVSTAGMSYSQVHHLLLSLYRLDVSDGEIAGILSNQSQRWQPKYQALGAEIRGAPVVHADETPWPIQGLGRLGYAWAMCPVGSPQVFFSFEGSRGAVHAQALFGPDFTGIRISDDYAPYRTLPGSQQLCWAHLYRCIRDLRYNSNLPEKQLPDVTAWYETFAGIYEDLRLYLDEPFDERQRTVQSDELWARLRGILAPLQGEPDKLTRLKAQLTRAGQDRLFLCLAKDTPCDNNRAERDLRGLVLKRKRSFGSKTPKGAKSLGVVLSLCLTTWRTSPEGYFKELAALGV
jgi:transposase